MEEEAERGCREEDPGPKQIIENKPVYLSKQLHHFSAASSPGEESKAVESENGRVSVALYIFPVRSPGRVYDMRVCEHAAAKPKHCRVKLQLSPPGGSKNTCASHASKQNPLTLLGDAGSLPAGSSLVALHVANEQVYLVPVDEVVQMRPSTENLNARRQQQQQQQQQEMHSSTATDAPTKGKKKQQLSTSASSRKQQEHQANDAPASTSAGHALATSQHVVRSTQAERREEQRMNSYSYMKQLEEQEPWQPLAFRHPQSERACALVDTIAEASHNPSSQPWVKEEDDDGMLVDEKVSQSDVALETYLDILAPPRKDSNASSHGVVATTKAER